MKLIRSFKNCIIEILMQKIGTISESTPSDKSNHTNCIIQIVPCKTALRPPLHAPRILEIGLNNVKI